MTLPTVTFLMVSLSVLTLLGFMCGLLYLGLKVGRLQRELWSLKNDISILTNEVDMLASHERRPSEED